MAALAATKERKDWPIAIEVEAVEVEAIIMANGASK
jgi:hypothetical protein